MIVRRIFIILFFVVNLLLGLASAKADSLTVAQVTQELKQGSVLTLRNDVAQDFAENLLAAQQPGVCSYCAFEPDSLQLSINAVLKAIALEKSFGLKFCDDFNCQIAWDQSTVAIDDRVSIGFTPSALNFGEVPVSTPEPSVIVLLLVALVYLCVAGSKPKRHRDYPYVHTERKA